MLRSVQMVVAGRGCIGCNREMLGRRNERGSRGKCVGLEEASTPWQNGSRAGFKYKSRGRQPAASDPSRPGARAESGSARLTTWLKPAPSASRAGRCDLVPPMAHCERGFVRCDGQEQARMAPGARRAAPVGAADSALLQDSSRHPVDSVGSRETGRGCSARRQQSAEQEDGSSNGTHKTGAGAGRAEGRSSSSHSADAQQATPAQHPVPGGGGGGRLCARGDF